MAKYIEFATWVIKIQIHRVIMFNTCCFLLNGTLRQIFILRDGQLRQKYVQCSELTTWLCYVYISYCLIILPYHDKTQKKVQYLLLLLIVTDSSHTFPCSYLLPNTLLAYRILQQVHYSGHTHFHRCHNHSEFCRHHHCQHSMLSKQPVTHKSNVMYYSKPLCS